VDTPSPDAAWETRLAVTAETLTVVSVPVEIVTSAAFIDQLAGAELA